MSHEIETMMWLGQIPWHGLGVEIQPDDAFSIEKCIEASGLGWSVELKQCFVEKTIEEETESDLIPVPAYATMRGNKVLGIVGERFTVLQNHDAFKVFQPFLDNKLVRLNTAGSLFGGEKVWILAEILGEPLRITNNDIVRKFILLSHGHNGKECVRFGFTPVRVVCNNTLCMAKNNELSKLIRLKHTKNVLENIENIRETIDLINQEFKATADQYNRLLNTDISQQDVEIYIKRVFDISTEAKDISTRQYNIIQKIKELFYMSPGNEEKEVRGTLWAAFNSITYYLSHVYGRTQESRLDASWFGKSAETTKRALDIAIDEFCENE
jgi:phage/plasmid-like protein (TIGR03299 family)